MSSINTNIKAEVFDTNAVIDDAVENGGGTYALVDGWFGNFKFIKVTPRDGYFVATKGGVENLPDFALTADTLDRIIFTKHRLSTNHIGLWRDDKGNWSIDETRLVADLNYALDLAVENNQRAIWDIANSREILV